MFYGPNILAGITANVVAPGLIATETTWSSPHAKPIFAKALEKQCVKRYGYVLQANFNLQVLEAGVLLAGLDASHTKFDIDRSLTILANPRQPADVAHAFSFLASPEASFISGQVLGCSGGMIFH
jgi:NAD(P)-dependent dehydrogenase (short-subunit alcohol dehydrogenase family)